MSQFVSRRTLVAPSESRIARAAFTLVEILVALLVSLILMGAVVSLFGYLGDTFGNAKADIEMSDRVNHAAAMLQDDLNNVTVSGRPAIPGEAQSGDLEIIEGRERDYTVAGYNRQQWEANPQLVKLDERLGDRDDILHMTLRNNLHPYVGKQGISISSGNNSAPAGAFRSSSTSQPSAAGQVTWDANCDDVAFGDDGMLTATYSHTGAWLSAAPSDPADAFKHPAVGTADFEYSSAAGATATWSFTVSKGGTFDISMTWPKPSAVSSVANPLASSIGFVIADASGTPIHSGTIDQSQNAGPRQDQVGGGRPFQSLYSTHLDPGDVNVTLTVPGGGNYVLADGVRIGSIDGGCVNGKGEPPGNTDDGTDGGTDEGSTDVTGSGYVAGLSHSSPLAEVIWFVTRDPKNPGRGQLHRYVLLISPDADLGDASTSSFFYYNDISARQEGGKMVANSLEDLALRCFRRAHLPASGVTSVFDPRYFLDIETISTDLVERLNETVVLDNVVAFDVQVYDEAAPIVGVQKPGTTSGFGGGGGGGTTGSDGGGTTGTDGGGGGACDLQIIDNNDPGFSAVGNWTNESGGGYKNQYMTTRIAGSVATWSFTGLSPGDYEVYVTWPTIAPNPAASNAHFTVTGDGDAVSADIDQNNQPSGVTCDGSQFKKIGTMNVTADPGSINVDLDIFGADDTIIADAVGIKKIGGTDGGTTDGSDDEGQSTGGISPSDGIDALVAGTFSLTPTDIRYRTTLMEALSNTSDPAAPQIVGYGAFVDLYQYIPAALGYETAAYPAGAPRLLFNDKGADDSLVYATPNTADYFDLSLYKDPDGVDTTTPAVYDTWSPWYNRSAVNQVDDDAQNGVDDPGEIKVPPPYSAPLKAMRVVIRVYEPTSGSVREVTVQRSFDQD